MPPLRDESEDQGDDGKPVDAGVRDKRLLVVEVEFAAAFKVARREGNTLSTVIRCAWDTGDIAPLTKTSRTKTTGAHVNFVGHTVTLRDIAPSSK